MIWIGLTGGIACGKSTVASMLRARGFPVLDADQLARDVVMPGMDAHREIIAEFGPDALQTSSVGEGDKAVLKTELNRKRIAEIVFQDRSKLDRLESIIHPRVRAAHDHHRQELQTKGHPIGFYDVPLLFEKNMKAMFDRVVTVACSPEIQKKRLIKREGFSDKEADRRIRAQMPLDEKIKNSDHVIFNNGSTLDLEAAVDRYIGELSTSFLKIKPGHQP